MTDSFTERACIVGAGQAGSELALALRQQGYAGSIVLIGDEGQLPYQRPPLSKGYLKGESERAALDLRQRASYERAAIELILDTRVQRIDRAARQVELADGRTINYAHLALATGGRPRRLAIPDAARAEQAGNFSYLRTIDDAQRIRERLANAKRLVVIGGGYIGLEVAATAVSGGAAVTVLEALPRVLARVTAPEVSAFYEHAHREAGVDIRTNVQVTGFEFDVAGNVSAVRADDGAVVQADLVVVGVGLVPNTELAQAAGLEVDNGIVVDEFARTCDAAIVAAGDCTNHPNHLTGRRVRLESVPNAMEQARTAAATLAGKERAYTAVPWFWSDQYDLKLQTCGLSHGYDGVVVRGAAGTRSFTVFYLRGSRIVASDSVNRAADFMISKRLVAAQCEIDPERLADESIPLKMLLPG